MAIRNQNFIHPSGNPVTYFAAGWMPRSIKTTYWCCCSLNTSATNMPVCRMRRLLFLKGPASLTQRVKELAERYETLLPQASKQVAALEQAVNAHLEQMGFVINDRRQNG